MGRKTLPTPEKHCEYCGRKLERRLQPNGYLESLYWFNRRKFCSIQRSAKKQAEMKNALPPETKKAGRKRASRLVKLSPCMICGKTGYTEVHHIDENPLNNNPENLIRLCKSCHKKQHVQRKKCVVCGEPAKGYGLCPRHLQAWKKSNIRGYDTEYTSSIRKRMVECGESR